MKATTKELSNNVFKPFKLEIEVSSEREALALYNIFNHIDIRIASNLIMSEFGEIRDAIRPNITLGPTELSETFTHFNETLMREILQ